MSNKIEIDKTVFDTLIYFCFGFTLNEEADKIVEIIIKKAYIDATNQGAFNTKIPKEDISRKNGFYCFLINNVYALYYTVNIC